jgi:beta-RFAP synthase
MPRRVVSVRSPSRLHFGLLSFGSEGRQFGGVGVMAERPGVELRITPAPHFETTGIHAGRVRAFAERWGEFEALSATSYRLSKTRMPPCRIEVTASPPEHVGLGVGTQLGLSVAAGLAAFVDRPQRSPLDLAASVGRGKRSAVGTYGFAHGGLIVERGKLPDEPLAPLDFRAEVPPDWRFVLIRPRARSGLSGAAEQHAFDRLPPVPADVTQRLIEELRLELIPAISQGDFRRLSESLYRFGTTAGNCFAARQGGPFNGPELTQLVERIRSLGVVGVGQSSWGPTLFALLSDSQQAAAFTDELQRQSREPLDIVVTPPSNSGALVTVS